MLINFNEKTGFYDWSFILGTIQITLDTMDELW